MSEILADIVVFTGFKLKNAMYTSPVLPVAIQERTPLEELASAVARWVIMSGIRKENAE